MQDIGLAGTILSDESVEPLAKPKLCGKKVPEISDAKFCDVHRTQTPQTVIGLGILVGIVRSISRIKVDVPRESIIILAASSMFRHAFDPCAPFGGSIFRVDVPRFGQGFAWILT